MYRVLPLVAVFGLVACNELPWRPWLSDAELGVQIWGSKTTRKDVRAYEDCLKQVARATTYSEGVLGRFETVLSACAAEEDALLAVVYQAWRNDRAGRKRGVRLEAIRVIRETPFQQ